MEYGKIIAVTGLPGLFELLSSKSDGAIVRSLEDKSSRFVSSRVHNFSHLESIEVFTVKDNVNLVDIFHAMEQDGSAPPDGKDAGKLKQYFQKVYPDLDFERVYSSDLKKMAKWYEVLKEHNIEIKLPEPPAEEPEPEAAPEPEELPADVKKPKAKKETTAAEPPASPVLPAARKEPQSVSGKAEPDKTVTKAAKKKATAQSKSASETETPAKKAAAKKSPPKKK